MSGARTKRARRLAKIFPIVADLTGHGRECDQVWWARHDSREAWYELTTPISRNARDSEDALAESNFRVAKRIIDAVSPFGTSYRWDAWPGGQIQTLVIRADDAAALREMTGIVNSLSDYPVLDDEDHSELEWEQWHPSDTECYNDEDPECCLHLQVDEVDEDV